MFQLRILIWFLFMVGATVITWFASDPHSFWVLWITIPALILGVWIEVRKKRPVA